MAKDSIPNLYALIVGINEYPRPIKTLSGCLPDAKSMVAYLDKYEKNNFNLNIETLYNAEATRDKVITHFKTHLAKARPEDVVLFFFAGHGAEEYADPVWKETNGTLQGLVCYDSVNIEGKQVHHKLLADKELRYLLYHIATKTEQGTAKAGMPHILVITDCCHSGNNTRGTVQKEPVVRMLEGIKRNQEPLDKRDWAAFLFADQISLSDMQQAVSIRALLPQGRHVAMAACQSNELATEDIFNDGTHGVFTKNLLEILERTQGIISYNDLKSRIKNYVKNQYAQIPQIYAFGEKGEVFKNFLGGSGAAKSIFANIQFDKKRKLWLMDMGAIHGISGDTTTISVITHDEKPIGEATIKEVRRDETVLTFASELARGTEYKGIITNFFSATITIFVDNIDGNAVAEQALKDIIKGEKAKISLSDNEAAADYAVRIFGGYYAITKRVETDVLSKYRPLVLPIAIDAKVSEGEPDAASLVYLYLHHIAQWEFVQKLENSGSDKFTDDAIDFQVITWKNKEETLVPIQEHPNNKGEEMIQIPMTDDLQVKIRLVNKTNGKLYVSLLYMTNLFEVNTSLLGNTAQLLEKKDAEIMVYEGEPIDLALEKHISGFNFPSSDAYLKLIVSTHEFSIETMERKPLPDPADLFKTMRGGSERGLVTRDKINEADAAKWATRTVLLRFPNPQFNKKPSNYEGLLETAAGVFLEKLY